MVATMAYRDMEVDPLPHVAEAASLPARPDWRQLYEQALKRAEAAEARAEELKWAEVAARSAAGSLKWQFKEARRKRLAAVEDANQARSAAKNALLLEAEVARLTRLLGEAGVDTHRGSTEMSLRREVARLRHLLHEALRLNDRLKGRCRHLRSAFKRTAAAKEGFKMRLRRATAETARPGSPIPADAELRKALCRSRRQKTALNALRKENARLRRTAKASQGRVGTLEAQLSKLRATAAVLSGTLYGRRSEKRETPGTGRRRGQQPVAPGHGRTPRPRHRGAGGGARSADRSARLRGVREALHGERRRRVVASRDRGARTPAGDAAGALAADLRLRFVAGGGLGAAGAAAVPQHAVRHQRVVALPVRALRVPATAAPGRGVAGRPGAAGRARHAGRQCAPLRAAVRTARRSDPRAPERIRAAPRRRDQLAGAGTARGGPFRPRLAVDLGRQRRGVLPHRPEPQRRGGGDAVRGTPDRHGDRLRPLQRLQEAGEAARRHGDPAVLLEICCIPHIWAHMRRDFIQCAAAQVNLTGWCQAWLGRSAAIYRLNEARLARYDPDMERQSAAFDAAQDALEAALDGLFARAGRELALLPDAAREGKALRSLLKHREGLSVFVDRPRTPMDNNLAERLLRGPVIGRRLSFGSDSETGARFTALMYSVVGTLNPNGIDVLRWLGAWLAACADNGGRPPDDLAPWLPWSMCDARRRELAAPT